MPEDYGKAVLAAYQKKKEDESLSSNLLNPTPGSLREECLIVYRERQLTSKDDEILRQFFGATEQGKGYFTLINSSFASKFKQMPKIIKGDVPNPGIKFIELLAWLIDFQPRTSISYYNSFDKRFDVETKEVIDIPDDKTEETKTEVTDGNDQEDQSHEDEVINIDEGADKQGGLVGEVKEPIVETTDSDIIEQPINQQNKKEETIIWDPIEPYEPVYTHRFSPRYITISCVILLLVGTTSFAIWERLPTTVRMPEQGEKFMYWDDDHYEAVKDEKQDVGAAIIPLNIKTLTQQQKITLPDTLTSYSIGKVWYKGHGKDHEFFTDSGAYPLDLQRVLKPLTSTILIKYTSNYRYMLTRLVWFLCAAFFIALCGLVASKLEKEVKSEDKLQENDIKETLSASETNEVMKEAELKVVKV